jgi:hypothetical protein
VTDGVPAARRRVVVLLAAVAVIAGLMLWIGAANDEGPDRLVGLVAAVFALYTLVVFGPFLAGRPVLEAGADGLEIQAGLSKSRVPWSEVEYIAVTHYQALFWRLPLLVVRVRDRRSKALTLRGRHRRTVKRRGGITYSLLFSALGNEDVLALIERRAGPGLERSEDGQALVRA